MPYRVLNMQTGEYLITPAGVSGFSKRKDIIGALVREKRIEDDELGQIMVEPEEEQLRLLMGQQWQLERIEND